MYFRMLHVLLCLIFANILYYLWKITFVWGFKKKNKFILLNLRSKSIKWPNKPHASLTPEMTFYPCFKVVIYGSPNTIEMYVFHTLSFPSHLILSLRLYSQAISTHEHPASEQTFRIGSAYPLPFPKVECAWIECVIYGLGICCKFHEVLKYARLLSLAEINTPRLLPMKIFTTTA